jgi:hypothetical protein
MCGREDDPTQHAYPPVDRFDKAVTGWGPGATGQPPTRLGRDWLWIDEDACLAFTDTGMSDAGPRGQVVAYTHSKGAVSVEVTPDDARTLIATLSSWLDSLEEDSDG